MFFKPNIEIEYSAKRSVNVLILYQSKGFSIRFAVPSGITLGEARALAEFLVEWQITGEARVSDRKRFAKLYHQIFNEDIEDFRKEEAVQTTVDVEAPVIAPWDPRNRRARRS